MALSLINKSDINPLKRLYNEASSGSYNWFNEMDWKFALKEGGETAENYLSAVLASKDIPYEKEKVEYLDNSSRLSYLYTNILKENEEDETKKQEYQKMLDEIEAYNSEMKTQYYMQKKDEERANANFFKSFGPNAAGFFAEIGAGAAETVMNLGALFTAMVPYESIMERLFPGVNYEQLLNSDLSKEDENNIYKLLDSAYEGVDWHRYTDDDLKGYVAEIAGYKKDDTGKYVKMSGDEAYLSKLSAVSRFKDLMNEDLARWEADHTSYRNYDGSYNYKSFQSAVGSVFSQAGRVVGNYLPTVLMSGSSSAISGTLLYTSFGVSDATETYREFKDAGVSINGYQIIANSAVKMIAQAAIEQGLSYIMGAGGLSRMRGLKSKGLIDVKISNQTFKRIVTVLKDMGEEAIEENLQDLSDFLINKATAVLFDEAAYNDLVDITPDGIMNTAVVSALASLLGSGFETMRTKNLYGSQLNYIGKMKSAQLIRDLQGVSESMQKLDKELSEKYVDMLGLKSIKDLTTENIIKALSELDENKRELTEKELRRMSKDLKGLYDIVNIAKNVIDDMGEESFKAAVNNLNVIHKKEQEGYFDLTDAAKADMAAKYILEKIDVRIDAGKLKSHRVNKVINTGVVENGNVKLNETSDTNIAEESKKLAALLNDNGEVQNVVVTDQGGSFVDKNTNTLVVSKPELDKSVESVRADIVEDKIYQLIKSNPNNVLNFEYFVKLGKQIYKERNGLDCDNKTAVYNLLFNQNGYHDALVSGNKDAYKLLTSLLYITKTLNTDKEAKAKCEAMMKMWLNQLIDYCTFNPNADASMFLSALGPKTKETIINKINNSRKFYNAVTWYTSNAFGVNKEYDAYMSEKLKYFYGEENAKTYIDKLKSVKSIQRQSVCNKLDRDFYQTHNDMYDGKYYMPDTSIANRMFNSYLKSIGKTLKTWLTVSALSDTERNDIQKLYGVVNNGTLLEYRKKVLSESTNGVYSVDISKNSVSVLYNGEVKGFNKLPEIIDTHNKDIDKSVVGIESRSKYLNEFLNPNMSDDVKASISISDIIENPNNLSDETKQNIIKYAEEKYGIKTDKVNEQLAYYYFNNWLNEHSNKYCLLYSKDGYVLGQLDSKKNVLKNLELLSKKLSKTKRVELDLKDYVLGKYYINGIKLVFDPNSKNAADYADGVITINNIKFGNNIQFITNALFHEYTHAIQEHNNLVGGFDSNLIVKMKNNAAIINDVREYLPYLFENREASAQYVNDIIYYGTGEIYAYGYGGTDVVDFIPFVSGKNDKGNTTIITPWGKEYDLTTGQVTSSMKVRNSLNTYKDSDRQAIDYRVKRTIAEAFPDTYILNAKFEDVNNITRLKNESVNSEEIKKIVEQYKGEEGRKKIFDAIKKAFNIKTDAELANTYFSCMTVDTSGDGYYLLSIGENFASTQSTISNFSPDMLVGKIKISDIVGIVNIDNKTMFVCNGDTDLDLKPIDNANTIRQTMIGPSEMTDIGSDFVKNEIMAFDIMLDDIEDRGKPAIEDKVRKEIESKYKEKVYDAIDNYYNDIVSKEEAALEGSLFMLLNFELTEGPEINGEKTYVDPATGELNSLGLTLLNILKRDFPNLDFPNRLAKNDKNVVKDFIRVLREMDDTSINGFFNLLLSEPHLKKVIGKNGKTYLDYIKELEVLSDLNNSIGENLNIENGKVSFEDIKNLFYRLVDDKELIEFSKKIFEVAKNFETYFEFSNISSTIHGLSKGEDVKLNTAYFNNTKIPNFLKAKTILHETIHACTSYVLYTYKTRPSLLNEDLRNAAKQLFDIYEDIRYNKELSGQYGVTDAYEMVAELSNLQFRKLLKRQSLFIRIIDAIKRIFGFKVTNAFDATSKLLEYILDNPQTVLKNIYDLNSKTVPWEAHKEKDSTKTSYDTYVKRFEKFKKKAKKEGRTVINASVKGIPKIDENGNQVFKMRKSKNGKVREYPVYVYPESESTRNRVEITKKKVKENPKFIGYTTQASRRKLSEDAYEFIDKSHDLPKYLQDKIDNGTLTERGIKEYFRDTENINDSTFKQINDVFFENQFIKTNDELNRLVSLSPDLYARCMTLLKMISTLGKKDAEEADKLRELLYSTDQNAVDKFFDSIYNNTTLNELYNRFYNEYDTFVLRVLDENGKYKNKPRNLSMNIKTLRMAFMKSYNGTLDSAGKLIQMVRYIEGHSYIESGEDWGTRVDEVQDITDTVDLSLDEMIFAIIQKDTSELREEGKSESEIKNKALTSLQQLRVLEEDEIKRLYIEKFVQDVTQDSSFKLKNEIKSPLLTASRLKNRFDGRLNAFYSKLTGNEKKEFIKQNSNLLYNNGRLRRDLYIVNNRIDFNKLNELVNSMTAAIDKFDATYKYLKRTDSFIQSLEKQIEEFKKENKKLKEKLGKPGIVTETVTRVKVETQFVVKDEVVTVKTTQKMPDKLKTLLGTVFSERADTMVKEVTPENMDHAVKSMDEFYEQNNEVLQSLSKEEALEIVEFFATEPDSTTVPDYEAQYAAVRLYALSYILRQNKLGFFEFTEEELDAIYAKIQPKMSAAGTALAVWKNCLEYLHPEKDTIHACMKTEQIVFSDDDINALTRALLHDDLNTLNVLKDRMYNDAVAKYGKEKRDILTRLWNFERAAMLSSPATWFRNYASNRLVKITNNAASKFGTLIGSKVLDKIFKKSANVEGYHIVGTKITDEVKAFVVQHDIPQLFELTADGLSKYDLEKRNRKKLPFASDVLVDMITKSVESEFRLKHQVNNEYIDKAIGYVYHKISDNKFIKSSFLDYFQKMLVENGTDLNNGLSEDVLNTFVDAYKMAAFDYMHTSNFINNMEYALKQHIGDKAFIAYKQIFPFLAPSYNWFVEGLRLTPAGLVKSIIDYARLEKKIQNIDERAERYARQGKSLETYDRSFAKYVVLRNIGKGMIGTIGFAAGALLAAFGIIKLTKNDDDEYVMQIGDFDVDISSIYGTVGFTLGLTLVDGIRDFANDDKQLWSIISDVFNKFAENSLIQDFYNTFRFSNNMGEAIGRKITNIPMMLVPNFIKTIVGITNIYGINYDSGFLKILEQYLAKVFPYPLPKQIDPYTGNKMTVYGGSTNASYATAVFANIINKLTELDVRPNIYSNAEKESIRLGVSKTQLTGNYKEKKLNGNSKTKLNEYYGKLNAQSLDALMSSKITYTIEDEKGKRVELRYNKMTDTQKATVIKRIMSDNANTAKVWYFTTHEGYKYYTNDSEYAELKRLGLTNIYKKTTKKEGLIK